MIAETINLISQLLRDDFVALVTILPYEFFDQPEAQRDHAWRAILHEINAGETDVHKLAAQAVQLMEVES